MASNGVIFDIEEEDSSSKSDEQILNTDKSEQDNLQ